MTSDSSKGTIVLPAPLPPRSSEVTPPLTVNPPSARSPSSLVQTLLQLPVSDPRYARDTYGTWCNLFVHDFLTLMSIAMKRMVANDMVDHWRSSKSPLVKMVLQDAIHNANLGCPTVFGLQEQGHGHVGVVLPQPPVTTVANVLVANVGASNFYGRSMVWAVPRVKLPEVEFFGAP